MTVHENKVARNAQPDRESDEMADELWRLTLLELIDGDGWKLADALLARYTLDDYPETKGARTGLFHALLSDVEFLRSQYGVVTKHQYLATVRNTAIAWPPSTREPSTSFRVHYRMRGKDRQAEMKKRLRQAAREKFPLNENMLARFRADENPKPPKSSADRLAQRLASTVKSHMLGGITTKREDWWNTAGIGDGDREEAVQALRALASKIARGEK